MAWGAAADGGVGHRTLQATRVRAARAADKVEGRRTGAKALQAAETAEEMLRGLQEDNSRHALRPRDDSALALSCLRLVTLVQGHVNRNTAANEASNWRHWVTFCTHMNTSPWRDDAIANGGGDGHAREVNLMALALLFIYKNMRPSKRTPSKAPKPSSALAVLRGIRRLHKRMGHEMVDLGLATRLAAALADEYVLEHGPEALMAHRTEPLSNAMVEWLVNVPSGTKLASGAIVDSASLAATSLRACFATMARTGFRADEVTLRGGHEFTRKRLSRWHLRWRIGTGETARWVYSPTAGDMRGLQDGDFAVLIPPCSKADQFGIEWGPSPIWLRYSTAEAVNAARALSELELRWPVEGDDRRGTPLFVDGAKRALSDTALRAAFADRLRTGAARSDIAFTAAEAAAVSLHSFRVYLACCLLELKRSHAQIQALLRWKTDEALRIYARLNSHTYADLLDGVGDVHLDQARTHNLPQHDVSAHVEAMLAARQSVDEQADRFDARARSGDLGEHSDPPSGAEDDE
jgi:hypothetical protein